jgi:isopropylmalate/homocitrate/citramalate synthase
MNVRCNVPSLPALADADLRDYKQAPRVAFSHSAKRKIAGAFIRTGVMSIAASIAATGVAKLTCRFAEAPQAGTERPR